MRTSDGESLFVVEHAVATAAERASLGDLGFMERQHLQEWVLKNPTIISADALVISAEFDRWDAGSSGQPRDRLDVLALGRDGRLIVAELKVGTAPHTVELQAIGYAAMVAAFSEEDVVDALVVHLAARQQHVAESEALDQIRDHVGSALDPDLLVRPRIVLIAEDFRPTTKTTCVWLVEMGLDVTLVEVHGYRTDDKNLVTTSQVFPPPEINVVRPQRTKPDQKVPWTEPDLERLASRTSYTVLVLLDLCAATPASAVPFETLVEKSGRTHNEARADLAVLTMLVKGEFERQNWPVSIVFVPKATYVMDDETASRWLRVRSAPST